MKKSLLLFACSIWAIHIYSQDKIPLLLNRETEYQRLSGSVMVVRNGKTTVHSSHGYASVVDNIPNTIDTPFDIASISKQFTAAAILHLVFEKNIKLNDNINQYLGEHASKKWKNVTIHHLLTHSSGIPSLFREGEGTDAFLPSSEIIDIKNLIAEFATKKFKFKPGKSYSYSNSGYVLLAAIIENVSGELYGDYMQENIFDRYKLSHTTFGSRGSSYAKPQVDYHYDITKEVELFEKSWMIGAGGIYSTVGDLNDWINIIQSNNFLNAELREKYLTNHVKNRSGYYGYGWEIKKKHNRNIIEHDGTNLGYVSYCGFDIDNQDVVIITTNQSYSNIDNIDKSEKYIDNLARKIWRILNGDSVEILPKIEGREIASSSFVFADGYQIDIVTEDKKAAYIIGVGDYTPSRLIFENPILGNDTLSTQVIRISERLKDHKYRKIIDICDKSMRFAVRTGIIRLGMSLITKDLGEISKVTPYYAANGKGIIRLIGENGIMDINVYFNNNHELMGIYTGDYSDVSSLENYHLYSIEDNKLYMDGFPYGEESAILSIKEDKLTFEQIGRKFVAKRIDQK